MYLLKATLIAAAFFILPLGTEAATRIQVGKPVSIQIPKIGVSAGIDAKGLTGQKSMELPVGAKRVAWYRDGAAPGNPGDAVMYGHFTGAGFKPAVFANLSKLKPKDKILVDDTNGNRHTFQVTKMVAYHNKYMTFNQLDGRSKFTHLNLYTCSGSWSPRARAYTHTLIAYSTLVKSEKLR